MSTTSSSTEYRRLYQNPVGCDYSDSDNGRGSLLFTHSENVYRDYGSGLSAAVSTFPGWWRLCRMQGEIHGIFGFRQYLAVHAGSRLFLINPPEEGDAVADSVSPIAVTDVAGTPALLSEERSAAITCGEELLLLDGGDYYRLFLREDDSPCLRPLREEAYVPITYENGQPLEQRNLLSPHFLHRFTVDLPEKYTETSEGLLFEITDALERTCVCTGAKGSPDGYLCIPGSTVIDGALYTVTEIAAYAFKGNLGITSVRLGAGICRLGDHAFEDCTSLVAVYCPDSLTDIGAYSLSGCPYLSSLYLGYGIARIAHDAFANTAAVGIQYPGAEEDWARVTADGENAQPASVTYGARVLTGIYRFPLYTACQSVEQVTVDGISRPFEIRYTAAGLPSYVVLYMETAALAGATVLLYATATEAGDGFTETTADGSDFAGVNPHYAGSLADAVCGCRSIASFDGRLFFTGNPALPNTVFFTGRNRFGRNDPSYVGNLNYVNDGMGAEPNTALLPTPSVLYVFKGGDAAHGAVYTHTAQDSGISLLPRIYPANSGSIGSPCLGQAMNFCEDPVYLSAEGLEALVQRTAFTERSCMHRSARVDRLLCREETEKAVLSRFDGYLCLLAGGNLYLADSHRTFTHTDGSVQYEWYRIEGVGDYSEDHARWFYTDSIPSAFSSLWVRPDGEEPLPVECNPQGDTAPDREALLSYPLYDGDGNLTGHTAYGTVHVNTETGESHFYLCDTDGLREGGVLSPARTLAYVGKRLYFGCENGALLCLSQGERDESGLLPPACYLRCGHAFRSSVTLPADDGGAPELQKDTVRGSACLTVAPRTGSHLRVYIQVITGRGRESGSVGGGDWVPVYEGTAENADLSHTDFGYMSLHTADRMVLPLRDRARRYYSKQYRIETASPASPLSFLSLCYRYRSH